MLSALLVGCAPPTEVRAPPGVPRFEASPVPETPDAALADAARQERVPAVATRMARLAAAAADEPPILRLDEELAPDASRAQEITLGDPRVSAWARETASQEPLRVEVLGVYPTHPSDFGTSQQGCPSDRCYRVELYNHARVAALVAIVDVPGGTLVDVDELAGLQPDIPASLERLAREIAAGAPEVARALGTVPDAAAALMAATKTTLNDTTCEDSQHLCVAPTFLVGDRALWAIVDLTDAVLVGTRWTSLGKIGHGVTERSVRNDAITARYCERTTLVDQDGWSMHYLLTSSDGLLVSDVRYEGRPVLDQAKLVDWHVSYSAADAFGYSDAVGCPTFSRAAVTARSGPTVEPLVDGDETTGFALTQDFVGEGWPLPCHYYYRQRLDFYRDGRFRVVAGNLGRGCGDNGTYRPVLRLAFAGEDNTFASWDGADWAPWHVEGWRRQIDTPATAAGYAFRVSDAKGGGYYVRPGRGDFGDGGRGDDAYIYVTRERPESDEGRSDLITIGPCCNNDYRQGPERFIEPQPDGIAGEPLTLWYVAQMKNDDRPGQEYCWADLLLEDGLFVPRAFPCYAGPMFVPIGH